ncbi:MAG: hypothetical protein LQ348_005163 [Seirophora lacunosa]|nr:MAG: hypothetical protein LQ348_005163 [Seirophora lacunosa]
MRLPIDTETRSLAYPVYQTSKNTFVIPATRSHYRTLSSHIYYTNAYDTSIEFYKAAKLPGRDSPVSCIFLKRPKITHELVKASSATILDELENAKWECEGAPLRISHTGEARKTLVTRRKTCEQEADDSFSMPGAEYPFLVVEVADSQSHADLYKKLFRWAQGTKATCQVMVAFEVEKVSQADYRILTSVIKNRKIPSPRPGKPNGYRIVMDYVYKRLDISSQLHPGSFTISATEVCREESKLDAATKASVVTIALAGFNGSAKAAIRAKKAEDAQVAQGGPQYDSDQEDASTPSSSGAGSLEEDMAEIAAEEDYGSGDDPEDLDYDA